MDGLDEPKVIAEYAEGEYTVDDNPFYEQHVSAEIDYLEVRTRDARKRARAIVTDEFVRSGHVRPRRCLCGELMWYRATTLTYSCRNQHKAMGGGQMFRSSLEELQGVK